MKLNQQASNTVALHQFLEYCDSFIHEYHPQEKQKMPKYLICVYSEKK